MSNTSQVPEYLRYVDDLPSSKAEKYVWFTDFKNGDFNRIYKAALDDVHLGPPRFAIKIKIAGWDITYNERMEVHALKTLEQEENVVRMVDLIRLPTDLLIVMDLAETDLLKILLTENLSISDGEKRTMLNQFFKGLAAIHKNKIIHRDIKPANVLISLEGIIKIADFQLSVPLQIGEKRDPRGGTLHYKALELLMEDDEFTENVDMWASGCSMAELWLRQILFYPEQSNVTKQIETISKHCSFPTEKVWPRVVTYQHYPQFEYLNRHHKHNRLEECVLKITQGDALAADLLLQLLKINPEDRISANQCLNHAYFTCQTIEPHVKSLLARMGC